MAATGTQPIPFSTVDVDIDVSIVIGVPVGGTEMKVVDDQDNDARQGEPGEIVMRGPFVMKGYWNNDGATAEAMRGGWFHTGAIATIDEDGYFFRPRPSDVAQ